MQFDDVQLAARLGGLAAVAAAFVGQVQLLAALLLLGGHEVVELLARGEPVLLLAEKDVVDRQPAGDRIAAHGVGAEADAAAFEGQQRLFERGQRAAESLHLLAGDRPPVARLEHRVGQAGVEQLGLHLLFGLHVVRFLLVPHAEQRRLGHVDVAAFDQIVHLAVEERQQQRADVRAVDVGVGHDDDFAVAALA